jgi:hypothetical protein
MVSLMWILLNCTNTHSFVFFHLTVNKTQRRSGNKVYCINLSWRRLPVCPQGHRGSSRFCGSNRTVRPVLLVFLWKGRERQANSLELASWKARTPGCQALWGPGTEPSSPVADPLMGGTESRQGAKITSGLMRASHTGQQSQELEPTGGGQVPMWIRGKKEPSPTRGSICADTNLNGERVLLQ